MGPSKFPGKPSKLVTKKRVSVVNSGSNADNNATKTDGKYQPKYSASDQCGDGSENESNSAAAGAVGETSKGQDGDSQVRKFLKTNKSQAQIFKRQKK